MIYDVELSEDALSDIKRLKNAGEVVTLKKIDALLIELKDHPETGTGKPEKLKNNLSGKWSRRITDKHRLIYEIDRESVVVTVLNTYGHYSDK
jgi:toxin YoeB